jgi:hypothetical protein
MSTTSSALDRPRAGLLRLALLLCAAACGSPPAAPQARVQELAGGAEAPRAPAPRRPRPPSDTVRQHHRPFALRSAAVHRAEPELRRLGGARFAQTAAQPIAIEVRVAEPIDRRPRDSAPVIVLNGRRLESTQLRPGTDDQLVALLPDRSLLRNTNEITVVWLGNERQTAGRPLIVAAPADGE